jgi:hypothetical protein
VSPLIFITRAANRNTAYAVIFDARSCRDPMSSAVCLGVLLGVPSSKVQHFERRPTDLHSIGNRACAVLSSQSERLSGRGSHAGLDISNWT